jgi:hypothetical protein
MTKAIAASVRTSHVFIVWDNGTAAATTTVDQPCPAWSLPASSAPSLMSTATGTPRPAGRSTDNG